MRLFTTILMIIILTTAPSWAEACYSKQEAEAEQGIRIHSELMVIGLNCQHMASANGNNLYLEHRKFTQKHADLSRTGWHNGGGDVLS